MCLLSTMNVADWSSILLYVQGVPLNVYIIYRSRYIWAIQYSNFEKELLIYKKYYDRKICF